MRHTYQFLLQLQPEVILIGYNGHNKLLIELIQDLAKKKIGLECMSIGAACRTFNILLSEGRKVVAGFILNNRK